MTPRSRRRGSTPWARAHQYCGELGKQANCHPSVTAEYIAEGPNPIPPLHWPVSGRLFLPDDWAADVKRRRCAHIPAEIEKQSKIEIALELIDRATLWKVPFRLVTADAAYGHFRELFLRVWKHANSTAPVRPGCNFGVRRPEEVQAAEKAPPPLRKGIHGRKPKRQPSALVFVRGSSKLRAWEQFHIVATQFDGRVLYARQYEDSTRAGCFFTFMLPAHDGELRRRTRSHSARLGTASRRAWYCDSQRGVSPCSCAAPA